MNPWVEQVLEVLLGVAAGLVMVLVFAGLVQLVLRARSTSPSGHDAADAIDGETSQTDRATSPDDPGPLVTVASYRDLEQAHLARLRLEPYGVPVFIADAGMVGVSWYYSLAVGGAKVQVPRFYAERAVRLLEAPAEGEPLDEPLDELLDDGGEAPHADRTVAEEIVCPKCNSTEVYRERRLRQVVGFLSILTLGFPLPVGRTNRTCESCGHRWKQKNAQRDAGRCPICDYDLRGTLAAGRSRCPECGAYLNRSDDPVK